MTILAVGQVENTNVFEQVKRQTVQPNDTMLFLDDNPAPEGDLDARRKKIALNHHRLAGYVEALKPDLVWQIEGDAVLPDNALQTLLKRYFELKSKNFGYVSGVQVGRHGVYALGAWHFNKDKTEFWSQDHKAKGLQQVDATGFYCLLAERETWLKGKADWNGERWGPDVNFGISLKTLGFDIYVDMDLWIGHDTPNRGVLTPDHISICNVKFKKDENGKWKYKTT